jgi:uncharacterized protein HemY
LPVRIKIGLKAAAQHANHATVLLALGRLRMKKEDYKEAEITFRKVLESGSKICLLIIWI